MKPLIVAITVAMSLPLLAADEQKPQQTTTPSATLSAPVSTQQVDSPLVRAAKATGRLNKKPGFVITNETLLRTGGGHIAWGSDKTPQPPLSTTRAVPADPNSPAPAPQPQPQPQPQAKPKTDASAKQKASSDYYGDSAEARHDDPAQQEHQMQQNTQPAKPPLN